MTVKDLADSLNVAPSELIKKLMGLGIMATLNNSLTFFRLVHMWYVERSGPLVW